MTMAMDVMNQIAFLLNDSGNANRLRNVLVSVAKLPEYAQWEERGQFTGRRFRLPRGFIPTHPKERRLLESARLVVDDFLQVKINLVDGLVFLTDGLFVPSESRVFPWHDESGQLITAMHEAGWAGWPTTIVDPATGCGHNALRVADVERFGLDVSMRALCFAVVNSLLNDRPFAMLGLGGVERKIPQVRGLGDERVLFLINMPFAIEPVPGALVRTAAGGKNGYEKTISALEAVREYATKSPEAHVRALVLAYSIGKQTENRWFVAEAAKRMFGADAVSWRTLTGEKQWRVNGKKEQPNPMPLSSLRLKAEDIYYVKDEKREAMRVGYDEKERELRRAGYDALAYGVLQIEVP
ncbi:MAG: hypothetical protein ABW156_11060 [Jiangellaceae bacterium]